MRNGSVGSLDGERIAIVGLAASGRAAARLALERGGRVHVSDLRSDAAAHARGDELRALGVEVDLGRHPLDRIAVAETVVASPGIPPDAPVLRELAERGVRWISEPEFAFRFFDGPLIVVTGTNGKTTTTALVAHLLEADGQDVALGGNIGQAFGPAASELALRDRGPAWYVVEMSSFQLAGIDRLRPDLGVVTNLAPDHLDRYASVEDYYADKANLFRNARCRQPVGAQPRRSGGPRPWPPASGGSAITSARRRLDVRGALLWRGITSPWRWCRVRRSP